MELSRWAAKIARERLKLDVFEGLLEEAKYPHDYFDVVVMMDVIEHLPDLYGDLREIRRILKPDGMLCVSTPDINSLACRLLRAKWWGLKQSHIFYFSRESLARMLDAAGFKVIRCLGHNRVFSMDYLMRRLKRYSTFLYSILKCSTKFFLPADKLIRVNLSDQIEVYAGLKTQGRLEEDPKDENSSSSAGL